MDIEEIIIGKRHREDLGDMEELKRSITELGLLQPIVVRKGTRELVAGYRRLNALKGLGVSPLVEGRHVNFVDIESILRGEYDENVCRKDFSISEKVAIFEAIKEEQLRINIKKSVIAGAMVCEVNRNNRKSVSEGIEGSDWKCKAAGKDGQHDSDSDKKSLTTNTDKKHKRQYGQSRSHAARAVGLHQNTLRKAVEIVEAAKRDPEKYGHLVKEMDETGKVEPIFQKYIQKKSLAAGAKYALCGSLSRLNALPGIEVPEFILSAMTCIPEERQEDLVERFGSVFHLVRQIDFDRGLRNYSNGDGMAGLSEDEIYRLVRDVLEHTDITTREWVFMPQVRSIASVVMGVAKAQGTAALLDKLDLFMIGLAVFADMACNYLKAANKEGIIKVLPADTLERYLAVIDAFQMLYESKLPRQVGALRMQECELRPGEALGTKTARDHANAMNANEMITDAAEGRMPYYRSLIAGMIQHFKNGADGLGHPGTTP